MNIKKLALFVVIIACTAGRVSALMPGYVSARAVGMGEAFSSIATENSALFYNPACLGDLERREISGLFSRDYFETSYSFISYGQSLRRTGGLALGMTRTSNEFERTDAWGNSRGDAQITSDVYMVGLGYYKNLPVSFGITSKFIRETIDNYSVSGFAFDVGSYVEVTPLRVGLVVQNAAGGKLSGTSVYDGSGVKEDIPQLIRFSVSLNAQKDIERATDPDGSPAEPLNLKYSIVADFIIPFDKPDKFELSPGAELWINRTIALRTGLREMKDYTAGLSFEFGSIRLDYGFIFSKELENMHLISTSIYLN
ncbi:MAG: PorV/PorQ family protein [Endomicrobiales bacterium]|nr:PorV/PorQ family protein [Endomicrobiales bacterium]